MDSIVQKTQEFTFQDLHQYVKEVKVDQYGIVEFYPGKMSLTHPYPYDNRWWGGHVYSGRCQINIIGTDNYPEHELAIPLVNFVFDEDIVSIINVDHVRGCAYYDYPHRLNITTKIDSVEWEFIIGESGRRIHLVLNDLLTYFQSDEDYKHEY